MAKIKIKIVNILGALVLITALTYFLLPSILFSMAKSYEKDSEGMAKAQIIYQRIANYFPKSFAAPDALYWLALSINPPHNNQSGNYIVITKHMTSASTSQTSGVGIGEAIKSYKTILEKYPAYKYARLVPLRLGELYMSLGLYEEAESYLQQSIAQYDSKGNYASSESNYKLIELYLKQHQPEKALEMYELYREHNSNSMLPHIYLLEGDAYRQLGQFEKAEEAYKKALDNLPVDRDEMDMKPNRDFLQEEIEARLYKNQQEKNNKDNQKGTIKGSISRDGAPLENVQIYLIDENITREGFSSREIAEAPTTFTNLRGEYEFTGIYPGRYSLGLGIPATYLNGYTLLPKPDQIMNVSPGSVNVADFHMEPLIKTITPAANSHHPATAISFAWEPVADAAYYQLELGSLQRTENGMGYGSSVIKNHIKENQVALNSSDFFQPTAITFDDEGVTPNSLLGLIYPGGEFVWNIKAFDQENKFLKESIGYQFHIDKSTLPIFFTDREQLNPGDEHILKREYDQAIDYFEKELEKNPENISALGKLSRLYQYHKEDSKKAGSYMQKLYEITNSDIYLNSLALNYYQNRQYQEAIPYLKQLAQEKKANWYLLFALGRSYIITGDLKSGEKFFNASVETKECSRLDPVVLKLAQGEWVNAYETLQKLDSNNVKNYSPLEIALKNMVNNPPPLPANWYDIVLGIIIDSSGNLNWETGNNRLDIFLKLLESSI